MEYYKSETVVVEFSSPNSDVLVTAGKRLGKYIKMKSLNYEEFFC